MTNEQRRRVAARLLGAGIVGVFFYALFPHTPDFALAIVLLVAVVVIWYDRDFPKRVQGMQRRLENNWRGSLGKNRLRVYMRESCL
jgi:membrane protein implicated in regulation of membrane protease activity